MATKLYVNDSGTPKLITIEDAGAVKTVNGVAPDDQGAVVVDAVPPAITVSAVTLAAGAAATVEKSGTDKAPVFTFGIPQGQKGDTGPQGEKGEKGDTGATGPQGPAGALSTLYSSNKTFSSSVGSASNNGRYTVAVSCDTYGRLTGVLMGGDCNCQAD